LKLYPEPAFWLAFFVWGNLGSHAIKPVSGDCNDRDRNVLPG